MKKFFKRIFKLAKFGIIAIVILAVVGFFLDDSPSDSDISSDSEDYAESQLAYSDDDYDEDDDYSQECEYYGEAGINGIITQAPSDDSDWFDDFLDALFDDYSDNYYYDYDTGDYYYDFDDDEFDYSQTYMDDFDIYEPTNTTQEYNREQYSNNDDTSSEEEEDEYLADFGNYVFN